MDLRQFVIFEFQQSILLSDAPTELKRALQYHERVPVFIDNLCKQIQNSPITFKKESIAMAVHSLTQVFINSVKRMADEKMMSSLEIERQKLEVEAKELRDKIATEIVNSEVGTITQTSEGYEIDRSVTHMEI